LLAARKAGEILSQLERGKTGPKELPATLAGNSEYAQTRERKAEGFPDLITH
jgi:hypothetical protein